MDSPRTLVRRTAGGLATGAVVALAAGLAILGTDLIAQRAAALPPPPSAAPLPVAASVARPETGYAVTRRFLGQIEARAEADLAFEFGGRLTEVLAEEGALVTQGAVLARTDISALEPQRAALTAELRALGAEAERARLALDRSDALTERGHRSEALRDDARLALTATEARMAALAAQIAGIDVQIDKAEVRAPFNARVGLRRADPGQVLGAGVPVLRLYDSRAPRLRVGLPPHLAEGLAPGDLVTVALAGATVAAEVLQLRPDLDPATRNRVVVVALPEGTEATLGETAALVLEERVAEPGFWAPLSALKEGARGSWTVMAIETAQGADTVVPAAVEVIHIAGDRAYLRGLLPPGNRIVGEAAHRVAPGQVVALLDR